MSVIKISEDDWIERFRPQVNHLDNYAAVDFGDGGASFETYGAELEYVKQADPSLVWTFYDDDMTIVSGFHIVNRLNYFVCEVPVPPGEIYEVTLEDYEEIVLYCGVSTPVGWSNDEEAKTTLPAFSIEEARELTHADIKENRPS